MLGTYIALYDQAFPEYRARMRKYSDELINQMKSEVDFPVVQICTSQEEVSRFLDTAKNERCDVVMLLSLGYTNSSSVSQPLIKTKIPLLLLNTQFLESVGADFSSEDMLYNHGMQGIQDLACVLVRGGKKFQIVTGLISQSDTREELIDHLIAARAFHAISRSRIARLGDPMPGMGDAQFDPSHLKKQFGIEVLHLDPQILVDGIRKVTQKEIHEARQFDLEHFEMDPAMTIEDHERSLRQEVAMRKIVIEYDLSGLTFSFDHMARFPGMETIPFLAITKLMAEGVSYGGEGDLLVTAGGTIARCLCDEVNFTEMYTMDFAENAVLDTHMAEGNWRMARKDRKPKLLRRQFSLAETQPFASLHFSLEPGEITLYDLTMNESNQFRWIALKGEVMDFPPLKGMEIPNFKIKFDQDIRKILNEYSRLGGTHHLSLAYGKQSRRFRLLSEYFDCHFNEI